MSRRYGPKMKEAAAYVRCHPGCSMIEVARQVGPNGSLRYGYAIVHRAVLAGLIRAELLANGTYRLYSRLPDLELLADVAKEEA